MPPLQNVEFEKVDLPEEVCLKSYYNVYHDSVLVIAHQTPNPYWVSIMNLNSMKIISNFITSGSGPEEMVSCFVRLCGNRLFAIDETSRKMKMFNLDSLILFEQSYNPQMYLLGDGDFRSVDVLTDSSFVFYNSWYIDNCTNDVNDSVPELIVAGNDANYSYMPPQGNCFVVNNDVHLLTDLNRSKTFVAYKLKPQITILNSLLDTVRIIYGPDPMKKTKYIRKSLGWQSEYYINFFMKPIGTENYFVVVNMRLYDIPRNKMAETIVNNCPEMYKFDWDGNLVARYKIRYIYGLSGFSEATNTLYVSMYDDDEELCLYKAQL